MKTPNSNDASLVFAFLTADGHRYKLSAKEKIEPKYWDKKKQKVKRNYVGCLELNEKLKRIGDELILEYRKTIHENSHATYDYIYERLKSIGKQYTPHSGGSFFEVYRLFLEKKSHQVKQLTLKKYYTLLRLLQGFQSAKNFKISFNTITDQFDSQFRRYLHEDLNHLNDTVSKYYECLKYFMRWAQKRNYHSSLHYSDFSINRSRNRNDSVYLTESELKVLIELDLDERPKLSRVRDIFCFQCLTGQRFSDVINMKWSDLKENKTEREWLLYQIKGNKPKRINIPIFRAADQIITRYAGIGHENVFGQISNAKANLYLKDICRLAGITEITRIVRYKGKDRVTIEKSKYEYVSTHTARRTFVTLSLEKGMRPEIVMEITGHEDFKTMRQYQKIIESRTNEESRAIWDNFNSNETHQKI